MYGGPLLMGLDAGWPPDAAAWLHAERQRLHARWQEACTRRLAELADDPAAASELAQALLRADPLDDMALQVLGRAQQALGRPANALAALRDYEQRLADAVGLGPSAALRALGEELQGRTSPAAADVTETGALVGRRQELAQIAQRLSEAGCRALTLLGPPGAGKSALARAVQAGQGRREDQVAHALWVPLEDLDHPDQLPERIARLATLALDEAEPPWPALARALGPAKRLLVLDNAEHLPLAPALAALLGACPALQLLVTSRTPLGLSGEWRLPIEGLPLPDADETDPEVLRANDAVRLFERRARPLSPAFDLAAEATDLVCLLHEVDGLPLAIELLAAWRRLMPVREILAELAESLDLLEPVVPHERSVRASFARAWQQLGVAEQQALAQMAVLPGPLSRAQVRAVLQAPLPVVAALADQSLLRTEDNGSFTLHPLIRRCAAPLAQDVAALRERHARHLAQRLGAQDDGSAAEMPHLRAAWAWAVEQADSRVLAPLIVPMTTRMTRRASVTEATSLVEAAQAALQPQAPTGTEADPLAPAERDVALALGRLTYMRSRLALLIGDLDLCEASARATTTWARRLGDLDLQASALKSQGNVYWWRGHYEKALALSDDLLAVEVRAGTARAESAAMEYKALALKNLGRYDEARAVQEETLAQLRRAGKFAGSLHVANNVGNLLRLLGRGREALALLHEALHSLRNSLDPHGDRPFLLANLALVHETLGENETAAHWAEQALASAQECGEPMIEAAALLAQARLGAALRRPLRETLSAIAQALAIGQRIPSELVMVEAIASAGVVLARAGRRQQGLALVRWAQRQPSFPRSEREDAERHLISSTSTPAKRPERCACSRRTRR